MFPPFDKNDLVSQTEMLGLDFPHRISEDYFGGRQKFYRALIDAGLLASCCGCPTEKLSLTFEKNVNFPRVYCKGCHKKSLSINNGSIFQKYGILHIPAFVFLCNCFVMNVPFEASVRLSGLDSRTARTYIEHVAELIGIFIQHQNRRMENSLGGEGKVVEIDEVLSPSGNITAARCPQRGRSSFLG